MSDRAAVKGMRSRVPGALRALALLILVVLLAYQLWLSYRDQIRTAEINTRNLAAIFVAKLDATLRRTDADLKALSAEIPIAALNQKSVFLYAREINAKLDSRMYNGEEMTGYRVHDAAGDTLYSSDRAHVENVNISDRDYFKRLRDHPEMGVLYSEVVIGKTTRRQVLVIIRALRDERGKFMGIVHGMLDLDFYRKQFQSLDLGKDGIVALRRSDNHAQVVRWPDRPGEVNKPLAPDHPVAVQMNRGPSPFTLHYSVQPENVERILSVQVMQNYPFYVAVGVGRRDVLAGWYSQVIVVGVSTLLFFMLVGALVVRLGRMRVREAGILTNLAKSESKFSDLAQMVPVGICHFDQDGNYTYANDRHLELIGRTSDDLPGSRWMNSVHPDDRAKVTETLNGTSRASSALVCEYRLIRPDGQVKNVIGNIQADVGADGRPAGFTVAQTDITLRKRAEAELLVAKQEAETANITKTRFLAAASHDLRQPIQAINLFRDALGRTNLDEEQQAVFRFLSMSVNSLGELLYTLLDISKLDAGLVKPQLTHVPVETLFQAIDSEFSSLARQRNLRFKLFYPFKSLVLLTDPGLLPSVLRNLIDNAFKYTDVGGVLVGARKRGGFGVIQVWDTGVGIDPVYREKIFEECFQIGNATRDRNKGLGIGLSIARRTARLLLGDVTFRSHPGRGTVFEITLPLARVPENPQKREAPPDLREAPADGDEGTCGLIGWKIVVIEDDVVVAKSLELLLRSMGANVVVFGSAEEALSSEQVLGADFYISDFTLPGRNGLELLEDLQRKSALPINAVLLTGETSPKRIELAKASCWPVLFKPAELSRLLASMKGAEHSRREVEY